MIKAIVSQHIMWLTREVATILPMLWISVFSARWVGVGEAGYFSIFIGLCALVFLTLNAVNELAGSQL